MGNEPGNSQKSKTQGQKFIQVFPGNKKTWINCEESNSSESAAWTLLPLRIAKKVELHVTAENLNSRSTGYVTWAD